VDIGEQQRIIQVEPEPLRAPESPTEPEYEPLPAPVPSEEPGPSLVPVQR